MDDRFFCVFYLGWAVWGTYDRVWENYFKIEGIDKIVSRAVIDLSGRYRIYMAAYQDFASPETQTLADEGCELFLLRTDRNPIFLREGEAPMDLAVLTQMADKKVQDRIQKRVSPCFLVGGKEQSLRQSGSFENW